MPDRPVTIRRRFDLRGQVQGVGFRPYVYRLATARGLAGYVANSASGAVLEVEGAPGAIDAFEHDLTTRLPPLARISELSRQELEPRGETLFRIRASQTDSAQRPAVTPDAATCADCLRELFDPADRRHRYPFINCTNCGPRYSIIRAVPYDRPNTTMAVFPMCPACAREYADPADRRFHAQPNACRICGPQLVLRRNSGPRATAASPVADDALCAAARLLNDSGIIAVKGIGGYHLACRADREDVVQRLRRRKLRDGKPLAVMVRDVPAAERLVHLTPADVDALTSPAAPIVLAPKAVGHGLAPSIAPASTDFGVMLAYAPLHHLLFAEGLGPLVMTSANLAGQPLTYRDDDAVAHLADVADAFLMHDREICRPIDDSVVQTFRDEVVPIRRARGYAPQPIRLAPFAASGALRHDPGPSSATPSEPTAQATGITAQIPLARTRGYETRRVLAVGGELKATVCLLTVNEGTLHGAGNEPVGAQAVLSEHLGDLTQPETYRHYIRAIDRLMDLCAFRPDAVACDLHPHYLSTGYARRLGLPLIQVQHHHAHIASVMAEWGEPGPVVGLSCDGTGFGTDGAVWGCEVLRCQRGDFQRLGHLEYFPLVGGDRAALETWRPTAALLRAALPQRWADEAQRVPLLCQQWSGTAQQQWHAGTAAEELPAAPTSEELRVFDQQAARGVNAPPTSSLGRLFDAASFLLGLCAHNRHEAEAAMALEAAAAGEPAAVEPFAYEVRAAGAGMHLGVTTMIRELIETRDRGAPVPHIAARFHETVARMLADAARHACQQVQTDKVALSGGCFANRRLLTRLVALLEADGRTVLYHRHTPCGDGGLSLGQAFVALWRLAGSVAPLHS